MSGLLDGLMQELGSDGVNAIASKLGVDPSQAQSALQGALPMIVGALANNTSQAGGADALHNALQQHTQAGDALQQLRNSVGNPDAAADGNAILGHIFGQNQGAVAQGVSHVSGIDASKIGPLLSMLAPLVMGYLGRQMSQGGMNAGQVSNSLGQEASSIQSGGGIAGSLINAVLGGGQKSGDGLDLSNILSAGASILGAFGKC